MHMDPNVSPEEFSKPRNDESPTGFPEKRRRRRGRLKRNSRYACTITVY